MPCRPASSLTLNSSKKRSTSTPIPPIETLVETALRNYIDQYKQLKTIANLSFGESIVAFREKHNISEMDIDPDEILGDVRDRNFVGTEVSFE